MASVKGGISHGMLIAVIEYAKFNRSDAASLVARRRDRNCVRTVVEIVK